LEFQNLSENAATFVWDFGDGTMSTDRHPTHRYTKIGIYFVTLTVSGGGEQASITRRLNIDAEGTFGSSVVVAVDPSILSGINRNLNQFLADLVAAGHRVVLHDVSETQPPALRSALQGYYQHTTPKLEGVIFVGRVPIPTTSYTYPPATPYRGLTLQYYMDLDGDFSYRSGVVQDEIDAHTGKVEIEIWASILPAYGSTDATIARINDYLIKNHRYRSRQLIVQRGFINPVLGSQFTTQALYNLQYRIISTEYFVTLNSRGNYFVGIDNKLGDLDQFPTSRISYEREMLTDKYDVANIGAHGSVTSFGGNVDWGGIVIDVAFARSKPVKPVYLLEHSCNTAAIGAFPNLASEFLYNAANNVLVFAGATAEQGGMGDTAMGTATNYEAQLLTSGETIGNAHFGPMKLPYRGVFANFRDAFAAQQIMLGDGTLRLQEFMK
jgi:PKD repeat protein